MSFTPRNLVRFGLTAALLSTTALAACSGESGEAAGETGEGSVVSESQDTGAMSGEGEGEMAAASGEMGEGEGGEGEGGEAGGHDTGSLERYNRLAFMRGHVEAGLALYRAGAVEPASVHMMHPVSETHAAEREGLDELGFKSDLFVDISEALEAGTASDEIESQLTEAEENLADMADQAGGDPVDILDFLMETTLEEYRIGVVDGEIVNAGEYQDAFGFARVASDYAADLEGADGEAVRTELERLQAMWPEAPVPGSDPAPVNEIAAQVARVQLELSGLR